VVDGDRSGHFEDEVIRRVVAIPRDRWRLERWQCERTGAPPYSCGFAASTQGGAEVSLGHECRSGGGYFDGYMADHYDLKVGEIALRYAETAPRYWGSGPAGHPGVKKLYYRVMGFFRRQMEAWLKAYWEEQERERRRQEEERRRWEQDFLERL